jgi:trans-aconitate methyltransferase
MNELDRISGEYLARPPDREVDAVFTDAIAQHVLADLRGDIALELGLGDRVWTPRLLERFDRVVSVDGSPQLVEAAAAQISDPRWQGVVSYFEEFTPEVLVDVVVATGVLEHVDDPRLILGRARSWLRPDGQLIVTVPNGGSLHRHLAVAMGLIDDPATLGDSDHRLGHQRVFTVDHLVGDIEASGFAVVHLEGLLAKTLPNALLVGCTDDQLRGLVQVGRLLPVELSGTLFVRAVLA